MGRNPSTINVSLADTDAARDSLIRFAAWTRIDLWGKRTAFADRLGQPFPALNKKLSRSPAPELIADVQRCLMVFSKSGELSGPGSEAQRPLLTPVLTSLQAELRGTSARRSSEVEPAWFVDLWASGPPRSSVETFVRGAALRSMLQLTRTLGEREALLTGDRRTAAADAVADLLAISGAPGRKGLQAIHLLAHLGHVALPQIEQEIWQSPVGYRSVRILGRILRNQLRLDDDRLRDAELIEAVGRLLQDIDEKRPADTYEGRSLWVESLRWAPADWNWVEDRLSRRALDRDRAIRERMYAAVLLHRRGYVDACDKVVDQLQVEGKERGKEGLAYTAAFLERLLAGDDPESKWFGEGDLYTGLRQWPPGRPELDVVDAALRTIKTGPSIPAAAVDGMKKLVAEASLQPDGTRRRRSAEVLDAAGLGRPAVMALRAVLEHPKALPWQREQATFLIGQLHAPNSLDPLRAVVGQPGVEDGVLHAALWAIGDICGTGRPSDHDDRTLFEVAMQVADDSPTDDLRWAATYALAMGRQPYLQRKLSELYESGSDRVTRAFALWGKEVYAAELARHRRDAPRGIASNRTIPRIPETLPPSFPRRTESRLTGEA